MIAVAQIHQKKSNQIYFHKKNCKSNIYSNLNNYNSNNLSKKIQSPNHKNNSNYYCPSFTETNSISNISTSKKKNQINISNTKTLSNEIISAHHGTLTYLSKEGFYTKTIINLPLYKET